MAEQVATPAPAAVPPPPPAAAAPAAPLAPVVAAPVVPPPPAVATPAAVPAAEPAKPAAAAPEKAAPTVTEKPAAEKPAAVPGDVEFKLPEGAKYDAEALSDFKALAKEHGITAKQAEAIFNLDQKYAKAGAAKAAEALKKSAEAARAADEAALKADKEFGGDRFDKTVTASRSALKQFFGEEGSKLIEQAGLDKHPALVKGLARIRAAVAEDTTTPPGKVVAPVVEKPRTLVQRGASVYGDPKVKPK